MARVTVNSGPVTADLYLRDVPPDQWHSLMLARRTFLHTHLPYDCRELLRIVDEAEQMFQPLGFASVEDMVRRGFELEPEQVRWAVEGLQRFEPNKPIPYQRAIELGKRGGDRRSEQAKADQGDNVTLKERGNSRAYILARLERDGFVELAAKVRGGELSANAAAIEAGFRKKRAHRCPACGHEW